MRRWTNAVLAVAAAVLCVRVYTLSDLRISPRRMQLFADERVARAHAMSFIGPEWGPPVRVKNRPGRWIFEFAGATRLDTHLERWFVDENDPPVVSVEKEAGAIGYVPLD